MVKISRALLSCYDKTGLVELAGVLNEFRVEIIATAGTLKTLRDAGIAAMSIADSPEWPKCWMAA
ncbi:MAG TPA: hypothetical protein PLI07_13130 [Candidatus Hydrogenedentes bacterium]|nr:hypothetical protein [Candidatus Hydrogenedentota bacterium]